MTKPNGHSPVKPELARKILAGTLVVYIGLCIVIAGLNYAVAPSASAEVASAIHSLYAFYENEFKVFIILLCSLMSFVAEKGGGKRSRMRRANVIGFCAAAIAIHVVLPLVAANREVYYVVMPLPWSSTGFQLLDTTSSFYIKKSIIWGLPALSATIIVFVAMNAFVFVGTLLVGRRLQCSTLCLMNGFIAEIWSPVLPLVSARGKKRPQASASSTRETPELNLSLAVARIVMFGISTAFTLWWILRASGLPVPFSANADAVSVIESYKYLTLELLMAMFFWIVWSGRAYCRYCPAGTALALVARLGGQRIATDRARCVGCGACSKACPLDIDVASFARRGASVKSLSCVGCGHCVDSCPSLVLAYETDFLALAKSRTRKRE